MTSVLEDPPAALRLGDDLELPRSVVTRAIAVFGVRGMGKTSTAVVLVEEAAAAGARFVVVDPTGAWYGLRSSADGEGPGLEVVVFGGYNADVPLEPTAGRYMARVIVDQGVNAVLDLERMNKGDHVAFVADFAEELYHLNRAALTLVVDEAPRFVPAKRLESDNGSRCLDALTEIVSMGRRKGLGAVLISQRPVRLHADVREQAEVLICHRLTGKNDRGAMADWLQDASLMPDTQLRALPTLEAGEAIVVSPTDKVDGLFRIRPKQTFDSSASPEVGMELVAPVGRAQLDLSALEQAMAETIEREQERDPEHLQQRIRQLERELAELREHPATSVTVGVDAEEHDQVLRDLATSRENLDRLQHDVERTRGGLIDISTELHRMVIGLPSIDGSHVPVDSTRGLLLAQDPAAALSPPAGPPPQAPAAPPAGDGPPHLKAGARRMLRVLIAYGAYEQGGTGLTRKDLSTLAVVAKGGTLSDYLSALRGVGAIVEKDGRVFVTVNGDGLIAPDERHEPFTPAEVVALHAPRLKAGARRMLDVLMRAPEEGFTRRELGGLAGVAAGGTLSDYLSSLRSRGLIDERAKRIFPGSVLYLGETR